MDPDKHSWRKDLEHFRSRWACSSSSTWGSTLSGKNVGFFDVIHVSRICIDKPWHNDEREVILTYLSMGDLLNLDTAISDKGEREVLLQETYPNWSGGPFMRDPINRLSGFLWAIKRGMSSRRPHRFFSYAPTSGDPSLTEYIYSLRSKEASDAFFVMVKSTISSPFLATCVDNDGSGNELLMEAMGVAAANYFEDYEDNGINSETLPSPTLASEIKNDLIEMSETILYTCVKSCNLQGALFCLKNGANPLEYSFNEDLVPEQPLYFLAGKGSLLFDPTELGNLFNVLLDKCLAMNEEAGCGYHFTDLWAYGWADVDDSSYFKDKLANFDVENLLNDITEDDALANCLYVEKRYRKWTVMHQAAYWGHSLLFSILLERVEGSIADQYLYYVNGSIPPFGDLPNDEEGGVLDSFYLSQNFGGLTALHAAIMHLCSKNVASFIDMTEERLANTLDITRQILAYHNAADDNVLQKLESDHRRDCEICQSKDDPYKVGWKSFSGTKLCNWYKDGKLLKARFRAGTLNTKTQTAADIALLKSGPRPDGELMNLFDERFDSSLIYLCEETGSWDRELTEEKINRLRFQERFDDDDIIEFTKGDPDALSILDDDDDDDDETISADNGIIIDSK